MMQSGRALWDGAVPCVFEMAPSDVTTVDPPKPFYQMVPRHSYFPLVSTEAVSRFKAAAPVMCKPTDVWFEYAGIPLKWHLPVGVLFDMHAQPNDITLPWKIIVHFQGFPAKTLISVDGDHENAVKEHYKAALKQALFQKYGNCRLMGR
jgi:autophagy-related protein 5